MWPAGALGRSCAMALPRGRKERLKLGLPAYVNRASSSPILEEVQRIPQVDEPKRALPLPVAVAKRHLHAAPGAFEIPEGLLSDASEELVVAAAQDGFNRWLDNISNHISHKNRDMAPLHIELLDLRSLRAPTSESTRI